MCFQPKLFLKLLEIACRVSCLIFSSICCCRLLLVLLSARAAAASLLQVVCRKRASVNGAGHVRGPCSLGEEMCSAHVALTFEHVPRDACTRLGSVYEAYLATCYEG
jgi:hypothetical protein